MNDNFIHINRYNSKMLDLFCSLSNLHASVNLYALDPTPEHMKNLSIEVDNVEAKLESMKNSLISVVKEIQEIDDGEIDVEQTENGFRM